MAGSKTVTFIPLRPTPRKWNETDTKLSVVASWFNGQGSRYFMVRAVGKSAYDMRIIVGNMTSVNRVAVSPRQVIIAARTLGIILDQEQLEAVTHNG